MAFPSSEFGSSSHSRLSIGKSGKTMTASAFSLKSETDQHAITAALITDEQPGTAAAETAAGKEAVAAEAAAGKETAAAETVAGKETVAAGTVAGKGTLATGTVAGKGTVAAETAAGKKPVAAKIEPRVLKTVEVVKTSNVQAQEADTLARRSLSPSDRTSLPSLKTRSVLILDTSTGSQRLDPAKVKHAAPIAPPPAAPPPQVVKTDNQSAQRANVEKGDSELPLDTIQKAQVYDTGCYEKVASGRVQRVEEDHSPERTLIAERRRYYWSNTKQWFSKHFCSAQCGLIVITFVILLILFLLGFAAGLSITHNIYHLKKLARLKEKENTRYPPR